MERTPGSEHVRLGLEQKAAADGFRLTDKVIYAATIVAVVLSAFGLIVGSAAYLAGKGEESELEVFYSPHQDLELLIAAVSVASFAIALVGTAVANMMGRGFRNELMRRWPAAPTWSAGEDGRVLRAKAGPALHAARYKKIGKGESSHNSAPY